MNGNLADESAFPTPENPTTPVGSPRLTFADDVIQRSQQFANDLLRLVPELEGVAIVHSYTIPQDRLPYGVVAGRNGALRNPAEIMHMAMQLHGTLRTQLENGYNCIRAIDEHMQQQAGFLKNLQEQVTAKQRELNGLDAALTQRKNE